MQFVLFYFLLFFFRLVSPPIWLVFFFFLFFPCSLFYLSFSFFIFFFLLIFFLSCFSFSSPSLRIVVIILPFTHHVTPLSLLTVLSCVYLYLLASLCSYLSIHPSTHALLCLSRSFPSASPHKKLHVQNVTVPFPTFPGAHLSPAFTF